ncbi:hypothetical protein ACJ2A9_17150 [Anaerobacillus sp. MEB173]|uniref:hypothetical protein n=1 Tax=Anaerobacillus sp. MEB173 TaxID=3383345 RepID=UPI003F9040E8
MNKLIILIFFILSLSLNNHTVLNLIHVSELQEITILDYDNTNSLYPIDTNNQLTAYLVVISLFVAIILTIFDLLNRLIFLARKRLLLGPVFYQSKNVDTPRLNY